MQKSSIATSNVQISCSTPTAALSCVTLALPARSQWHQCGETPLSAPHTGWYAFHLISWPPTVPHHLTLLPGPRNHQQGRVRFQGMHTHPFRPTISWLLWHVGRHLVLGHNNHWARYGQPALCRPRSQKGPIPYSTRKTRQVRRQIFSKYSGFHFPLSERGARGATGSRRATETQVYQKCF